MSHRSSNLRTCVPAYLRTCVPAYLLLALTGNAFAADVANQAQYDAALTAGGAINVTSSFGISAMPGNPIGADVTLEGVLVNPDDPLKVLNGGGGAYHAFTNFGSTFGLVDLRNLTIENFGAVAIQSFGPGTPALDISNVRFVNNINNDNNNLPGGGAVAAQTIGSITDSVFIGNKEGAVGGGAVYAYSINNIKNTLFADNVGESGGAIFTHGGIGSIENSTFINNRAYDDFEGGALAFVADIISNTTIKNSAFLGNYVQGSLSSGGAIFHISHSNSTLTIGADAGSSTVFYGNRHGTGYNAITLGGAGTTVINVNGAGTVLMLDPIASPSSLTTVVNQAGGDWYLGGVSEFTGQSTWNINGGALVLTDVNYTANGTPVAAAIKLNDAASTFTVGTGGTLAGSGSVNAATIAVNGTLQALKAQNTGALAADLTVGSEDVGATESSPFGILTLDGNVTMDGANVVASISGSEASKVKITGNLTLANNNSKIVLNVVDDTVGTLTDVAVVDVTGTIGGGQTFVVDTTQQGFLKSSGATTTTVGGEVKVSMAAPTLVWSDLGQSGGKYDAHGDFDLQANTTFTVTGVLADHTNTDTNQSNTSWDGKTLTKKGDGTLILNAVNTYTGDTKVDDGTLVVGSVAANGAEVKGMVHVANGAVISGHGLLAGGLTLAANATVAPGTATTTGTLSVTGNVDLGTAWLDIKVNPDGTSDKLAVSGDAKIANATLGINSGGGAGVWAANTTYTILEAAGGLNNEQFAAGNVVNSLAFLDHTLDYTDPNKVELTLTRNNATFASVAGTPNQRGVANAIASLGNAHAVNVAVTGLGAAQVAAAYDNLSGEIYGSVRSALLGNNSLRNMAQARMQGLGAQGFATAQPVMLASNGTTPRVSLNTPSQRLWVNTWAYNGDTDGSRNVAKTDHSGIGLALGGDVRVADGVTVGAMFGYEDGKVKNSGTRRSRTDVDAYSLGGYATADLGGMSLQGGLIYSHMKLDSSRTITVPGLAGKAKASYDGYKVQAFVEAGKSLDLGEATVTPYVNLTQTWLHTDAAREKGSAAALRIGAQNDSVTQTTLGVRTAYQLPTAAPVALTAHLGWAHAFGDTKAKTSNRFGSAGSRFAIEGNRMDKNRALVGVGVEAQLAPNTTLAVGYDGQFGSNTKDHAGNVQVRVKF